MGLNLWFSELPGELDQAKASGQECPLRTACLAGAIERAEPCGVWGGEIPPWAPSLPARDRAAVPREPGHRTPHLCRAATWIGS